MDKRYFDFIDDYFSKKKHSVYVEGKKRYSAYSSGTGKSGYSEIFISEAVEVLTDREFRLLFKILSRVKKGRNIYESGVVKVSYVDFKDGRYSPKFFKSCIGKYVKYNYLVPTPAKKYFILNPLYINKFFKIPNDQ